eukprot:1141841-Pelagomonas_calceolata.AAC.2
MLATGDFTLKDEQGKSIVPEQIKAEVDRVSNNYARPDGQVGYNVAWETRHLSWAIAFKHPRSCSSFTYPFD